MSYYKYCRWLEKVEIRIIKLQIFWTNYQSLVIFLLLPLFEFETHKFSTEILIITITKCWSSRSQFYYYILLTESRCQFQVLMILPSIVLQTVLILYCSIAPIFVPLILLASELLTDPVSSSTLLEPFKKIDEWYFWDY